MNKIVYIIYMDNSQRLLNIIPMREQEAKRLEVRYFNSPEDAQEAMREVYLEPEKV